MQCVSIKTKTKLNTLPETGTPVISQLFNCFSYYVSSLSPQGWRSSRSLLQYHHHSQTTALINFVSGTQRCKSLRVPSQDYVYKAAAPTACTDGTISRSELECCAPYRNLFLAHNAFPINSWWIGFGLLPFACRKRIKLLTCILVQISTLATILIWMSHVHAPT